MEEFLYTLIREKILVFINKITIHDNFVRSSGIHLVLKSYVHKSRHFPIQHLLS